jgi:probable addiction module antidote protein
MIAKYLNNALASGDVALITKAIGDMVWAQGPSRFSRKVGLSREGLYRSFGGQMGPGFDTVIKVLLALDRRLVTMPIGRPARLGAEGEGQMTGPRPAGRPWTLPDDDMLRKLQASGMKPPLIAQKMKRSIGAIRSRIYLFKKPRERQESGRPVEPGLKAKK